MHQLPKSKEPPERRLRSRLPNTTYFLRRELCSRVSDTDLCRKRGQNPIPEGKIGHKTNELLRRLRLNHRGPGPCTITVAKSIRHWAPMPAAPGLFPALFLALQPW